MDSLLLPLWLVYALSCAILWGIGYAVDGQILKTGISPVNLLIFHIIIMAPLYIWLSMSQSDFIDNVKIVVSDIKLLLLLILSSVAVIGGNLLIYYSIAERNASLASIIEISYPFFVIIFSWLLFREVQVNLYTALGGILIFAGIVIIYLKN